MSMTLRSPDVSFVLATHNRCAVVMDTLSQLLRCGLDRRDYEIILVDNASDDGTPEAVEKCVFFRVGGELKPAAEFAERFHRPYMVRKALAGEVIQ